MITWFQIGYAMREDRASYNDIEFMYHHKSQRDYWEFWAGWDAHAGA